MMSGKTNLKKKPENPPYDYFAQPDGEDVAGKLRYCAYPAAASAFVLSSIDVMLLSKPKGYINILMRYGYVSFPILGCTAAFILTTNALGALRNKSDKLNWTAGGMAAGAVIGVWRRKPLTGCLSAVALGFLGCMRKYGAENNFAIMPDTRPFYNLRSGGYDYTLAKHIPGNYTTGPKE